MGEDKRSYDSVNYKWKNRIRPKVSQFCEIYNSVRDRHQSGSCDNTVYQEAELEYRTIYNAHFTLTESHIGVNLNDEAADSEDVEAQEVPAPMGRDRAKKKGSSSGARSETSIAGDPSLVDALLSKFTMAATPFFTQRKESSSEYLRIKERELELEERKRQEQGELERLRIAQREKELDLQQKMFEFQQQQKFEEDLRNSGNMASTWRSPALQLQFINAISTPVVTSYDIEGKDDKPFALALVDVKSQVVVSTRIIASIELDFDEYNNKIVSTWNGRKVLQGNTTGTIKG
ncbi:hypothetical protein Tco_1407657, partial [Tanacetum coccineum]